MTLFRRSFFLLLAICLGCAAQSASPNSAIKPDSTPKPELNQKIERQVRAAYKVPPELKILVGAASASHDFPDYDSVVVTIDGGERKQDLTFLVSKDRTSLMRLVKYDLSKDPYADTMSKIDTSARPTRGAKASKVVIVNYDDFECPYCSRMHQELFPELLKEYGDRITFVYKDYPLVEIHPWAMHAAVDANCLAAQNGDAYWDFADYIHANQHEVSNEKTPAARFDALDRLTLLQAQKHNLDTVKVQACIKGQDETAVKASMKEAEGVGVEATPTLFINGERVDGLVPPSALRAMLDRALKDANLPVPDHAAAAASAPAAR